VSKARKKKKLSLRPVSSLTIARLCNVSQGTVDRAIHNREQISEETRTRILKVAARYGYVPNPAMGELLAGSSSYVGAIVPAVNSIFFMDILSALSERLRKDSLRLLIASATDSPETHQILMDFIGRRMRGTVLMPPESGFRVEAAYARTCNIISIVNPCAGQSVPFAAPDETRTGRDAVAFLTLKGHRRIMHLSYKRRSWAIESRENGYREGMKKLGQAPFILRGASESVVVQKIRRHNITAVFCHNDWLALAVIRTLNANGLRVPKDVSVMGVDDSPTFNAIYNGLTTMHYPVESIVTAICSLIIDKRRLTPIEPCKIVERETVAEPM
jgi:LacI family transcriptional regulator